MNLKKLILPSLTALLTIGFGAGLTSCDDPGQNIYKTIEVKDTELVSFLKSKGYSFDDQGNLILNPLATNTTELDLSGVTVEDFGILRAFPKLTALKLAGGGYGPAFDVTVLPERITTLDLSGNDIYEFPGLVRVSIAENGEETAETLRAFDHLTLPASARFNTLDLPHYAALNPDMDLQMEDGTGALKPYDTLRAIPDPVTLGYLQKLFPSLFEGEKIDLSNRIVDAKEASGAIDFTLLRALPASLEGIEYVVMNPSYKGTSLSLQTAEKSQIPYLRPGKLISKIVTKNIDTPHLMLQDAAGLVLFSAEKNDGLTTLDLSGSEAFGQRGFAQDAFSMSAPAYLGLASNPNLKEIIFPEGAEYLYRLDLSDLPALKALDLSGFKDILSTNLYELSSTAITYQTFEPGDEEMPRIFTATTDVFDKAETQAFLQAAGDRFKAERYDENPLKAEIPTDVPSDGLNGTYRGEAIPTMMNGRPNPRPTAMPCSFSILDGKLAGVLNIGPHAFTIESIGEITAPGEHAIRGLFMLGVLPISYTGTINVTVLDETNLAFDCVAIFDFFGAETDFTFEGSK